MITFFPARRRHSNATIPRHYHVLPLWIQEYSIYLRWFFRIGFPLLHLILNIYEKQNRNIGQATMKTINVVAALIIHDGRIFVTQRGYGEWKGWWEFPGGKVKPGEEP